MAGGLFIQTKLMSTNIFALADGHPTPETTIFIMDNKVRDPARTANIVPVLANRSLLSGGKYAEVGYVSVCDGEEVNIYDEHTAKITESQKAFLKGWWRPRARLWWIPLQAQVVKLNLHTLPLNGPTGQESLNSLYIVPSSAAVMEHIELFHKNPAIPSVAEAIHNFYKLPSIERTIQYLHAAAGFPTKSTWIKSIYNRNYLTCPLITLINVNKHFPESEETQKGNMQNHHTTYVRSEVV